LPCRRAPPPRNRQRASRTRSSAPGISWSPDGKKSFPFGETPKGILIFTADGRFAQIHVAGDVPKIASNNRLTGTAEEYAAIMRRSLSVFGT
jgi:hypothetical protein